LNLVLRSEREMATLRALYVPESPDEPIADVALRRLDTAQGLLAQSLLAAWAPHPEVFAVPALTRWTAPGETLWRSSRWMPTRSPHAWGIGEDSHFYEMPVTAAIAWAYAGGRTISELEGIVVDHCRAAFGIRVRAATVHSVISRLLDFGAIRSGSFPPPASGGTAA
jgi:hypothetical protein